MTPDTKRQLLRQITEKCGMPSDRLQFDGADGVIFNLQPTDEYQRVDCLLAGMKKLRWIKLGFIGNEQYAPEEK